MTGPKQILERVKLHMEVSSVHGGNLAQIMILKVLQQMHYEGFMAHGDTVSDFYQERCEKALKLTKKHLTGLAEWRVPHGGIFLWLRMLGSSNSTEVIRKAHEKGATFTDGAFFMKEGKPCEYIRMSYSLIDDQDMETAVKILASVLREEGNQDGQENPENKDLHD
ncbi:kynurenine/alpha-aminoadipate aminotransferase, mitochondrial-like [Gigantopelta aegis]|uniref:kynurenine/alpha-aminoadipate aminotransferase, mitochondrial-like n=1 Tax=Gigantopelta aegis TaxID=1735272 RepID=UPI001B88D6F7|nr:kynurenine/alpha-aminoadipate aminotransferase, mitochondrial-like [Gigantopelta aegis]